MEVEGLVASMRKLYFILVFIKDQIKHVDQSNDELHALIATIANSDQKQWKHMIIL